jgi:RNA polymerase sigma-70 factor, ECF subfamily
VLLAAETRKQVQQVMARLSAKDRKILHAIFFEQRDKDEVCCELGVSREYLRVLLHRAKQQFVAEYRQVSAPKSKEVTFIRPRRKAAGRTQSLRSAALSRCC